MFIGLLVVPRAHSVAVTMFKILVQVAVKLLADKFGTRSEVTIEYAVGGAVNITGSTEALYYHSR